MEENSVKSVDSFELATDIPIWNYTYDGEGNDQDDRGKSPRLPSDYPRGFQLWRQMADLQLSAAYVHWALRSLSTS